MRRGAKPAKAKVEGKLPAARKPHRNEGSRVSDLEKRLAEALEQQAAAAEILRVIASSPANVQPVFDAIVRTASRLCDSPRSNLMRVAGEDLQLVARCVDGSLKDTQDLTDPFHRAFPMRIAESGLPGLVVLERRTFNTVDAQRDERLSPARRQAAVQAGFRSLVGVPLVRDGVVIGALNVARTDVEPYTAGEIELLQIFADQAVIAIENVRLFTELQEKNRALTQAHAQVSEALEQQTATSEILGVISQSPTDVQPVLDAVAASAARLCAAYDAIIFQLDGNMLRRVAHCGPIPAPLGFAIPATRSRVSGRAVINRQAVQVADAQAKSEEFPETNVFAREHGFRTILSVPLLREGVAIGTIDLRRTEVQPFTDAQIALLQTFADQAVIAIENVRLFNETKEALERGTATSEILSVISGSPTDVQPVFETILDSATRLCAAANGILFQYDDGAFHTVACQGLSPEAEAAFRAQPARPGPHSGLGRMLAEKRPVQVPDVTDDIAYRQGDPLRARTVTMLGARTAMWLPLLKGDAVVGALAIYRRDVRPFTDKQIELVGTFADQAVIAIENVRLFKELEARNRDLTEALEQQTATSEILQVISQSPTEAEPVFATIVRNAVRLCGASHGGVYRFDGELIHSVAHEGFTSEDLESWRRTWPQPATHATVIGQAIRAKTVVRIPDIESAPELADLDSERRANLRARGSRSLVAVPMRRQDDVIGAIGLAHPHVGAFSEAHVDLLKTFADQAVIAIENVRLFKELEARNRDLTDALDRQTATADILRVISQAQADVQPVFDTIVDSAVRLCRARFAVLLRITGRRLDLAAHSKNVTTEWVDMARQRYPVPLSETAVAGVAILERRAIHVPDLEQETRFAFARELARTMDYRSIVFVPMLREDTPIGAIGLAGNEPFTDGEIELLKTFADQAVIAIENVRLFAELKARTQDLTRSVEQLTALGDVGRALSSTLDLDAILQTIVTRASQLAGTDACSVFEYDEATEAFHLRATHNLDEEVVALARRTPIRKGEGVQGLMAVTRQPVQIPDIAAEDAYRGPLRDILLRTGTRALLAIPMLREDELIGGLSVARKTPGEFSPEVIELLKTFATQSALAIQNARLFREIEDKSRQLEAASQHKSEFLANMSHELRTPLNAIIGFSEVLSERMFGELNEKQEEYLKDIYASGQHLLSLINDILDLSKIEAGRMELELTDFDLPQAISNALTLVRGRAARRDIALHQALDQRLGAIRGDERKIKQVLLNLLSNALKFTPEGGRVEVRASVVDGMAEVSVTDTGVGIAPEDQEAVFEEFRQVGTADKKMEGTGLGLALARKFIELHGGRIWVKSQVGVGSTFTFTLPLTIGQRQAG